MDVGGLHAVLPPSGSQIAEISTVYTVHLVYIYIYIKCVYSYIHMYIYIDICTYMVASQKEGTLM